MKTKISTAVATTILALGLATSPAGAVAQSAHTIRADFGTRVAGPNSIFTLVLSMDPPDIDISGFSFKVAYDNTQVTFLSATDNSGQTGTAAPHYSIGDETPLSGVPNVNVFKPITMDTAQDLKNPTNLVELTFQATSGFNDPQNRVYLHLEDYGTVPGLTDGRDTDKTSDPIPTEYLDSNSQPVPVTVSAFTLE